MCYILNATSVAQEQDWSILPVAAKYLGIASTPLLQPNNIPLTTVPLNEKEKVSSVWEESEWNWGKQ